MKGAMSVYNNFFKRIFDIIVSVLAIIILSPIFIAIPIMIKLESQGPVFFKQRRIGKDAEEFLILKYRSMRIDTPNVATDKLTHPEQYVTKVGKFLRKTSLDEIPQLFNIIKGDMSIVGPRPALFNQYNLIEEREKVKVNSIKPGLTGYAQVKGRDLISDEEKVAYDLFYLNKISFIYDVKLIMKTFISVVKSEGVKG